LIPDLANTDNITKRDAFYTAKVHDFELHSAFQPVISLIHNRPVGYEALIRPYVNGKGTTPDALFKKLGKNAFAAELDRTCRTLHLMNAGLTQGNLDSESLGWLFLNVDARTILEDFYTPDEVASALEPIGFRPEHVVLEILEKSVDDRDQLCRFVDHYKEMGFKIAVDDFGAGESNLERIHTLRPSIVKLDRAIIQGLAREHNGINVLRKVVDLLREMGSLVLLEGVETEEQALLAMETEADLVQGFYFSQPVMGSPPKDEGVARQQIKKLSLLQRSATRKRMDKRQQLEEKLRSTFEKALDQTSLGPKELGMTLFRHKHVLRYYILDYQGYQIGETFQNPRLTIGDTSYHPLQKMDGACWSRRDFFFEAVRNQGQIFFSQPYLSLPEETLSITLSSTFVDEKGVTRVLCVDVDAKALDKLTHRATKKPAKTKAKAKPKALKH
jgi:EAL domain-containing protein (putative c-di-GMP-specific phosphodiesterase class I)